MITLKVRTASWSIRSSRETRKVTTVLLVLSFSYNLSSVFFFLRFRGLTPQSSNFCQFVFGARAVPCYALATWQGLFREDSRARFANPSDFEHRNRSRTHGRPPAVRLKRDSNTVPGPQVPAAAGRGKHQPEKRPQGGLGWVGGGMGEGACGAGAHGGAARADAWRRGTVPGWGKVGPPRGCSPRGRAGSVWLEGVPCSPFAHARLRFFLGPQDQRARDDRPRTHGHAVAAARE